MKPELREELRLNLVTQLNAAGPAGIKIAQLMLGARLAGFTAIAPSEIAEELDYLAGKTLVAAVDKLISPENPRWKITAAGRDYAAVNGL